MEFDLLWQSATNLNIFWNPHLGCIEHFISFVLLWYRNCCQCKVLDVFDVLVSKVVLYGRLKSPKFRLRGRGTTAPGLHEYSLAIDPRNYDVNM
jgi:hypothetical protein